MLLVMLPLAGLAWLGARVVQGERARLRESLTQVMQQRTADVTEHLAQFIATEERELNRALEAGKQAPSAAALREISQSERLVSQFFLINPQGVRVHPPLDLSLQSNEEAAFLQRTESLWNGGTRLVTFTEAGPAPSQGWHVWYHGNGARYLFWNRHPAGQILGVEVAAPAFLADLITQMPSTQDHGAAFDLTDAQGRSLYRWGTVAEPAQAVSVDLTLPLEGWKLRCTMPDVVASSEQTCRLNLLWGLGASGIVMALSALYLYRESMLSVRLAGQRVSFVNQVSHELKTPLTNISLYAELAAQKLPLEATDAQSCLDIVTSESARLGRLISNVLTFSKHQRGQVQPRLAVCNVVALLQRITAQFAPALAHHGLILTTDLPPALTLHTDADLLEQIIGNLLSNVEKYASTGGTAHLRLSTTANHCQVSLADHGPGIPATQRERIFTPFVRLSDKLSDGTAGTGIGLSIARELATILGGTLTCEPPADAGARFLLTLPMP